MKVENEQKHSLRYAQGELFAPLRMTLWPAVILSGAQRSKESAFGCSSAALFCFGA
jgi:hypothetical protein